MVKQHDIQLVPWSPSHEAWLKHAIGEFFRAGMARGGELLDTERNIHAYYTLGIVGASKGDPCLLALVEGTPVAYVLWVGAPQNLDSRWRTILAVGSYTTPAWRSKTIATLLRERALDMSRAKGYERVQGPVHNTNTRGLHEFCTTYGAWPVSTTFELSL